MGGAVHLVTKPKPLPTRRRMLWEIPVEGTIHKQRMGSGFVLAVRLSPSILFSGSHIALLTLTSASFASKSIHRKYSFQSSFPKAGSMLSNTKFYSLATVWS